MFTLSRSARVVVAPALAVALLAASSPISHAQQAAKLKWGPAPAVFPHGAKMAVVSGDPSKAGTFTAQLSMPSGYRIAPHWHPTDEHILVKQGTLLLGMGDTMSVATMKTMKPLKVGESGVATANMHHYAAARGHTVIEVSATGPFALTYVNPADDPQKAVAAKAKGKATKVKAKA
jgi:quercetin dioxygenase-like cupin family protein